MQSEKFYVLNKDNKYFEFNSWEDLLKEFKRTWRVKIPDLWFANIGHNFNDTYTVSTFGFTAHERKKVDYVIFDSSWRVVRREVLIQAIEDYKPKYKYWKARSTCFAFRYDSAPRISRRRYGNYYRHPKTTNELKSNIGNEEFLRGRRKNLPTWYDDVPRSDRYIKRSWKKQKKRKQWM